ncbi:hypothetical protein Bhyg_11120 [Pseudolycoriella hygida]|uniref:Uncharacterized protein n=1 Tax=Pseudolycoriella hygida TaxID=35572 RepID=A0A9Q0RY16_9DIPT|nr:hypothetical protein Bhyg_11120 [Pseudolycoriella hygida]
MTSEESICNNGKVIGQVPGSGLNLFI